MRTDHIVLENGEYGVRASIVGPWTDDMIGFLINHHVAELELNEGKGWGDYDLTFLSKLPHLRALIILHFGMPTVEPIHCLHELRYLEVSTYCKTEINFAAFPQLERCALEWRPKAKSVFHCSTLKRLFINRYKGQNTDPLANLVNLETLAILNAPIKDLHGLGSLKKLSFLRIAGLRCLPSLAGLERLPNLQRLWIDTCRRLTTLDELAGLHQLRKLTFDNCGEIESLKPLANLKQLEWVYFAQSTDILDGDLSPLMNLPNLSRITFKNRPHYSHRREDFGRAWSG